ncbi:hypothetical protein B0H34DRAFT_658315 [Crassisporium funariophilum]|nr:hypothetical protein B0H34DRAFT_658315 [Crassisporium funariophilum]
MLDSSPVALPPISRPLKRSASTASLPPTPPRTHRKHARGRSRGSVDSDSDEDAVLTSDDEERGGPHKRRRMGEASQADEEAFWLGDSAGLKESSTSKTSALKTGASMTTANASQSAPLLYRRRQAQVDVAPVSPPPSHRKQMVVTPKASTGLARSPATMSPPVTPKTRSSTRRALRDSPDNPFLATPKKNADDSDTASPSLSSANPSPRTPFQEKPSVTYVFRGVRRTYANPLYNHAQDRPLSPPPGSKLPIEHPDYSPTMHCTPKLLFPDARMKKGKKAAASVPHAMSTRNKASRQRSPSLSADEGEDAEIRPSKLNFGGEKKQTLDHEFRTAGEPLYSR